LGNDGSASRTKRSAGLDFGVAAATSTRQITTGCFDVRELFTGPIEAAGTDCIATTWRVRFGAIGLRLRAP
jgi:hypothetical protein